MTILIEEAKRGLTDKIFFSDNAFFYFPETDPL